MSSSKAALIARFLAQRERPCEVEPGVVLTVRCPAPLELMQRRWAAPADMMIDAVVGWSGVTEAVLFGARQGSDAAVEFSPELWREVAKVRVEWVGKVSDVVTDTLEAQNAQREDAAKN